jgi:ribose-phosphate pyrophosphokinase
MYINGRKLRVRRYSSGELKFIRSDLDSYIVDNKVKILYLGEYSLFELLLVLNYYVGKKVLVDLILSYLPYQRMDHKGRDELDTVNYVADIFNNLKLNSLTICEPHCDIDCFNNASSFSFVRAIKDSVFEEIGFDVKKDVVVLTDKGGLKRYGDISENVVYFNKERDLESGLIIKHNIVGNIDVRRNVVIVDDIISTGDTIVNIIDELLKMGVNSIYVLSGHIENNKYNKRIVEYGNVIRVYSTNSLKRKGNKKLKLFDVKNIFESRL